MAGGYSHDISTTTESTINKLCTNFAKFGIPKELVFDNGPQLVFANYQNYNFKTCFIANHHLQQKFSFSYIDNIFAYRNRPQQVQEEHRQKCFGIEHHEPHLS